MDFLSKYGIKIKNQNLLLTALTHSSYAYENHCEDYERLEFLGDAVLQVIMSEYFYKNTTLKEGQMSKERSSFVCEEALACYVKQVGYDKYIRVGHGLVGHINDTIIADTFEAVLAVIYLECGLEVCQKYIYEIVIPYVENHEGFFSDYKTSLQELVQTDKKSLEYILVESTGEAHNMQFKVNVVVDGIVLGSGIGKSKKEAEQKAAAAAIRKCAR
ncbi:MAG: ribonuclease III [Firmicutes bacterium]|nr:ribonuclease III [Bacillota bacterium]